MRFTKFGYVSVLTLLSGCIGAPSPTSMGKPVPAPVPSAGTAPTVKPPVLPPPVAKARDWDAYRQEAARRVVLVNAGDSFSGPLPQRMQSIPVLQVHLNRDGSVRRIEVLRTPKFAPHTVQLAMAAVHRAAPFGPVGHLPQPWQFNETFLYNDDLKFQLRSLVTDL